MAISDLNNLRRFKMPRPEVKKPIMIYISTGNVTWLRKTAKSLKVPYSRLANHLISKAKEKNFKQFRV